ncbi:MAG: hypothetical protein ACK58L_11635, partial [Planctomycetota bacterium]
RYGRFQHHSVKGQGGMLLSETLTHGGFRWVAWADCYHLDFPLPDRQPRPTLTLGLCLGTSGVAIVHGILAAAGKPFGDGLHSLMWVLVTVGGFFSIMSVLDDAQRRSVFRRCIACLDVGPEIVSAEDRAGREQKWRRAVISSVRVDRHMTGDSEPGNSQVFYEVMLCFDDGSSLPLWGRGTRDDFPFFRQTEFDETSICATVAWLSNTLQQVLGLPVDKADWTNSASRGPCLGERPV